MPFTSLGLEPAILQAVKDAGYVEPTPIQSAAIPVVLTGQDVIGIAQTGTGKTAAFTLPILSRMAKASGGRRQPGIRTLILAPTRELAAQIEENVKKYSAHFPVRVATVFGGVGERPQIDALRAGANIIIACPGRLLDLMGQGHGDFRGLDCLVLDEADRMLDMGFLPSIKRIVKHMPARRQTLLFSATLSPEIEALTKEFQHAPKVVQVGKRSNPAESVAQWVYEVPVHLKPAMLSELLKDPVMDSVLVFTRTKHGADKVARKLEAQGIRCGTLHSNRSQNQRLRALKEFKDGQVRVLVATDIAARGIDVEGISHVINYDFPPQAEDYVHRIGRTGRARAVGDAISFITPDDRASLRSLERFIGRGLPHRICAGLDLSTPPPPPSAQSQRPRGGNQGQGRSQDSGRGQPSSRGERTPAAAGRHRNSGRGQGRR
jgi:ATP-dependent RNA helicase RhlE